MEIIEAHLFHGFLGLPEDWQPLKSSLASQLKGKNVLCRFFSHNLWDDFEEVIASAPHGTKNYLEVWGENKKNQISSSKEKKFFLGYSLGGRLLMHLPLEDLQSVVGVGMIASHPGIIEEELRKQRLIDDCFWSERFIDEPWDDIMNAWNAQSVFMHDKKRPKRKEERYQRKLLDRYFKEWGLGVQKPRDQVLLNSGVAHYWFYGEKDSKCAALLPRIKKLIGPNHCFKVEDAGHGPHWDNPEGLAKILLPLLRRG